MYIEYPDNMYFPYNSVYNHEYGKYNLLGIDNISADRFHRFAFLFSMADR